MATSNKQSAEDWFLRGGERPRQTPPPAVSHKADPPEAEPADPPDNAFADGAVGECDLVDDDEDCFDVGFDGVAAPVWPPWCFGSW